MAQMPLAKRNDVVKTIPPVEDTVALVGPKESSPLDLPGLQQYSIKYSDRSEHVREAQNSMPALSE
jgi:hypothetical protein